MKLTLVIPVYNEVRLIRTFWAALADAPLHLCHGITACELVVVDDGSRDGTSDVLRDLAAAPFVFRSGMRADVVLNSLPENRGKGHAVRVGIGTSTGDIVLVQDADLEYSPTDYPRLLQLLVTGEADAVLGSRYIGTPRRVGYFWHTVMNSFLTLLSNMLNNINLTDMETCYKAIRGDLARSLRLTSNRFGVEPELAARLAKARARMFEVPISYRGRTYKEGKKIGAKDGVAALWHIARFGLLDPQPFVPGTMRTQALLDGVVDVAVETPLIAALRRTLDPRRSPRILELGAGLGSVTRALRQLGGTIDATDASAENAAWTARRFARDAAVRSLRWDGTTPLPGAGQLHDALVAYALPSTPTEVAAFRDHVLPAVDGGGIAAFVVPHAALRRAGGAAAALAPLGLQVVEVTRVNALDAFVGAVDVRQHASPARGARLYCWLKRRFGWLGRRLAGTIGATAVVVARAPAAPSRDVALRKGA